MLDEKRNAPAMVKELMDNRKFTEAAACCEKAASAARDNRTKADYLKGAALAYKRMRDDDNAVRCCQEAAQQFEKMEKAECLVDCFGICVSAIAGLAYDCSFEWRGETDGGHDDDHDINQNLIREYSEKGEKFLREAFGVEGAGRRKVLRLAEKEYKRMKKEGGWGSGACREIITKVTKES